MYYSNRNVSICRVSHALLYIKVVFVYKLSAFSVLRLHIDTAVFSPHVGGSVFNTLLTSLRLLEGLPKDYGAFDLAFVRTAIATFWVVSFELCTGMRAFYALHLSFGRFGAVVCVPLRDYGSCLSAVLAELSYRQRIEPTWFSESCPVSYAVV